MRMTFSSDTGARLERKRVAGKKVAGQVEGAQRDQLAKPEKRNNRAGLKH